MKKKSLVVAGLFLIAQMNVHALDTLHLNIRTSTDVKLQFKGADLSAPFKITPATPNWILKITNRANLKITLGHVQATLTPIEIGPADTLLAVSNNKLIAKNFTFQKKFRLQVLGSNNAVIKNFMVDLGAPAATTTNVTNPNNPQSGDASTESSGEHIPGSMVYDALALADIHNYSDAARKEILSYYAQGKDIAEAFKGNKFLAPLIKSLDSLTEAQSAFGISSVLASVGGLDVTKYADGIAKFLVKRVKQELSVAFFEKFKAIIDSTKDLATVFPKTTVLLQAIGVEVYDYERYIQNLREAFKADIVVIHRNLPGIVKNHPAFFDRHPEVKASLLSGCYIAVELENQSHPGDILANYPLEYLEGLNHDFSGAIQTLQILSGSLRDTSQGEESTYWVPISALRQLVNNQLSLRYYLGLVYHEALTKYDSIPFQNTSLVALLDKVADQYDRGVLVYNAYKRYILRFAEKTQAINKMIQEYDELPSDSAALEKYGAYLRTVVDFIQYCTQASNLPLIDDKVQDLDSLFNKYFQVAYSSSDLLTNISKKNYSAAINDVVRIYNLVRVKPLQDENDIAAASVSVKTQSHLAKYGSFMASVATAKTPDEVSKAIEAAALPVGSSRVKRETLFNVSLNAYVGPYVGYEKIKGVDSGKINAYGITAPIGFSVSKGYSILFFKSNKHRTSSSIFFSLIDLGAITAFRFTNDSTEKVPTIELKDIFSPGIFYSHGFGRTPLSLNIGYQVGPLLRRVRLDENEYGKTYSRFSVSLVVDIPVFNLYTR